MRKHRVLYRVLTVIVVLSALVATMFAFTGCNKKKGASANLRKATDIFAFAAVSTGAVADNMATGVALAGEVSDKAIIAELDKYMSLVDSLIAGNPTDNKVEGSDRAEYKTMQVMKVPTLSGEWENYKLYYNESAATKDEEDDEYESHIQGIMVIDGNEFPVTGDIEREEDEQEIEFKVYLDDTKTNYIELSQEVESKESEYEYTIHKDGKTQSFELEIETKDYKNKFGLEIEDDQKNVIEYEITKDTEKGKIKVEYRKNKEKGTFDVVASTDANGNTTYKYYLKDTEIDID